MPIDMFRINAFFHKIPEELYAGSHEETMGAIMHADACFITVHLISRGVNNRAAYNIVTSRNTK